MSDSYEFLKGHYDRIQREQRTAPEGAEHVCPRCYHPLDVCSHCDVDPVWSAMIARGNELLATLVQVRNFYLNAQSSWSFSEGFPIDVVCRVIAKAEGEKYPPFEGTEVMDGDEDRT